MCVYVCVCVCVCVSLCGVIDTCTVLCKRAYMYGLEALHVWQ